MKVAAVCYRKKPALNFLLVRTKGGKYWIFPKGGIEKKERPYEAAAREAREEAGALGCVQTQPFAQFAYPPSPKKVLTVPAFLLEVINDEHLLQGEPGRLPTWFGVEQTKHALLEGRDEEDAGELLGVVQLAVRLLG